MPKRKKSPMLGYSGPTTKFPKVGKFAFGHKTKSGRAIKMGGEEATKAAARILKPKGRDKKIYRGIDRYYDKQLFPKLRKKTRRI